VTTISAVIPTYNRAQKVCHAIRSVLDQSFQPCEIIVVDDGSSDNTLGLLHEKFGSQVTVIKHQLNQGISAARRTGYRAAKGEWIAYLDSDDLWPHNALEKLIEQAFFCDQRTVVIAGDMLIGNKCGERKSHFKDHGLLLDAPICPVDCRDVVFPRMLPYFQSSLIRRSALVETKSFEESLRIGEDTLVFGQLAALGKFVLIPNITCHNDKSGEDALSLHQDEIGNPHFPLSRVLLLRALNTEGLTAFRISEYAGWVREWIRRQQESGVVVGPHVLMEQFRYGVHPKSMIFACCAISRNALILCRAKLAGRMPTEWCQDITSIR
jgi:glycosyltransferase involved in cell wall biosynthesis